MSIAPYIKEIGRGKEGARSLSQAEAYDLMSQVLDGHVTDLELGAFAMAMRIKGESTDELTGFLDAVQERCIALRPPRPIVVLPSYNGARKLPNLTALLALLLAQDGVPVLVHGPAHDPGRVTTAEIFHDLGLPQAREGADLSHAWARHEPVFVPTEVLCPPLARLLEVRWVIGLRNPGHTVAKLVDPTRGGSALRVCNYTHPEYGRALATFLQHVGANAMLLRGTEGEPVADPRRLPKLEVFVKGVSRPDLSLGAQDGVLTELPVLPRAFDAATTAHYIQSVVSGEKPAPAPLMAQADVLRRVLAEWSAAPQAELSA
ncbi:MAG TPA: DNA-binding protein YbiB [Albitalea sp.]|nr:DNA-binding protein YbiB [Albitalea sp.]